MKKSLFFILSSLLVTVLSFSVNAENVDKQNVESIAQSYTSSLGTFKAVNGKITVTLYTGETLKGTMPNASGWYESGKDVIISLPTAIKFELEDFGTASMDLKVQTANGNIVMYQVTIVR